MNSAIHSVHINISFEMLCDPYYMNRFIKMKGNPEIYFDSKTLDSTTDSEYRNVARTLSENGLSVTFHGPFVDMSAGSPDETIRECTLQRFEQTIGLIEIFHPKAVVFHAGYDRKRYAFIKKTWIENSLQAWSSVAKRIQDAGSRLMLENVFEESPRDMTFLCDTLKQFQAGFCLDIGHLTVFSLSDTQEWLNTVGDHIGHLHLHDNNMINDDHLGMGKGQIDFQPLFDYLKSRKQNLPVITLEPHDEDQLLPSLEYLNQFLFTES